MFTIIIFLILFNFIVLKKQLEQLYNYLNKEELKLEYKKYYDYVSDILFYIYNKAKEMEQNVRYKYYDNIFETDNNIVDDENIIDDNNELISNYFKNNNNPIKCILYKLNKENNNLNILNKLIDYINFKNIKLYLFGYDKLDENNELNDIISKNNIKYISPYNFYTSILGYLNRLPNNEQYDVPTTKKITTNYLLEEIKKELSLNDEHIINLDENLLTTEN